MSEAYIVGAVRTPMGRGKQDGALNSVHPVHLMAQVLDEAAKRAGVPKEKVEDVIVGCVSPTDEQGANIARLSLLKAGFPVEVPGVQINRMCGSSQQAVHFGSQAIDSGDADIVIAGGIESMSRVPMGSDWGVLTPEFLEEFPFALASMGECAERIAEKWGLTRRDLDEFGARSHQLAAAARANGWFADEIMPIEVGTNGEKRVIKDDEGIRDSLDIEKMGALKTPFRENGVVTAANASQITDGAAAIVLASGKAADELGLKKRARIVTRVVVGSDPALTLTGPIPATQAALKKAGMSMGDIDVVEINEAFASVVLAWAADLKPDMDRVNPVGGAIAMGHPLGATGAILMTKMLHELERTGKQFGLQTMCIGHGMATATIIERL
jgi:acetyl-CoA acyltransferase